LENFIASHPFLRFIEPGCRYETGLTLEGNDLSVAACALRRVLSLSRVFLKILAIAIPLRFPFRDLAVRLLDPTLLPMLTRLDRDQSVALFAQHADMRVADLVLDLLLVRIVHHSNP
jgi:hypothetical protein